MKIVINRCYGGFSVSEEACKVLGLNGPHDDIKRYNPKLVELVENDSERASGAYAKLKIVDVPDDVEWQIEEYDGMEWVAEVHRVWS